MKIKFRARVLWSRGGEVGDPLACSVLFVVVAVVVVVMW